MSTELKWTMWQSVDQPTSYEGPAVYRIRLVVHDRPHAIPRFLGPDTEGILSIGKTGSMKKRRSQFKRGLAKGRGHSEANLLHLIRDHSYLLRILPEHQYQYCFAIVPDIEQASSSEEELIKDYFRNYGEVPPLNSAIPNRYPQSGWSSPTPGTDNGTA